MRDFDFLQPESVAQACRMLAEQPEESRAMAGGTALMLVMRQRMLTPRRVVSIGHLDALRGIRFDADDGLRIGPLTLHAELATHADVNKHYPMLASMAGQVANPQVRNQGTLGGNLCYADPATDPPGCLMALAAEVVINGPQGERRLSMEDFLVDYYTTALQPGELITEVRVPAPTDSDAGRYYRHLRSAAEHRPMANMSAWVQRDGSACTAARLVVGAATPVPARLPDAEAILIGRTPDQTSIAEAADAAAAEIEPLADDPDAAAYRRKLVRAITRRNLTRLFELSVESCHE